MNELNPNTRVRSGQLLGSLAVTALFLALLVAAAVAGGAAARSATTSDFSAEDGRRTAPRIVEPTDSLRKVQIPVVEPGQALVDICAGEGLVSGSDIDTATEMRALIGTYCYPLARLADVAVDDSYPQGRLAGRVDE